jgi:hypothetical protein
MIMSLGQMFQIIYLFIYIFSILVSSNVGYGYILLRYLFYWVFKFW